VDLVVDVLAVEGCSYTEAAVLLVEAVACRLDVAIAVQNTVVATPKAALRLRFLGSPTVRVEGLDVEPGAGLRCDYALGCRLYRTASGLSRIPAGEWIAAALADAVCLAR
jgi:hypothetical protein